MFYFPLTNHGRSSSSLSKSQLYLARLLPSVEHGVPVVDVPALLDDLALPPDLLVAHPVDHRAPVRPHGVGAAARRLVVSAACNAFSFSILSGHGELGWGILNR